MIFFMIVLSELAQTWQNLSFRLELVCCRIWRKCKLIANLLVPEFVAAISQTCWL